MGVLSGIRIIEFEGIGPGPFAGMLLADMGADVLRIDRPETPADLGLSAVNNRQSDVCGRGRRSITLDLKKPESQKAALELMSRADALIEGFRPGTMERLGLGPDVALAQNPCLVYGRMTGWGQTGPWAERAGHDLNYIALSGMLSGIGRAEEAPVPPLNLVGDYGGGGMLLALGVVAALLHVHRGGHGQVVDAAMIEGAAQLGAMIWGMFASGDWKDAKASNILDGGAPWYDSYRTSDGYYMSVGSIESRFYAEFIDKLGLCHANLPAQHDRNGWPILRQHFADAFLTRTREEWCAVFDGSDACVAPVLSLAEAPTHAQNIARNSFIKVNGITQPSPAPRFLSTPSQVSRQAPTRGQYGYEALREWGFDECSISRLCSWGVGYL